MKNQGAGGASELDLQDRTSRRALTLPRAVRPDSSVPSSTPGLTPGRPPAKPAPTSPLTGIPGCPRNGSAVGRQTVPWCSGQIQRPLLRRRVAPLKRRGVRLLGRGGHQLSWAYPGFSRCDVLTETRVDLNKPSNWSKCQF